MFFDRQLYYTILQQAGQNGMHQPLGIALSKFTPLLPAIGCLHCSRKLADVSDSHHASSQASQQFHDNLSSSLLAFLGNFPVSASWRPNMHALITHTQHTSDKFKMSLTHCSDHDSALQGMFKQKLAPRIVLRTLP